MNLPIIAIVGRPNVGKSTLFNRLAGKMISIVDAQAGVTRDRLSFVCQVHDRYFELVDTGGYGIEDLDKLGTEVEQQIGYALERATAVVFLLDAQSGPQTLDRQLAQILRKAGIPIMPVANKVDSPSHEHRVHEFEALGFGPAMALSALHAREIPELLEAIAERLPEGGLGDAPIDPIMKFAIVGPRNAGKSTFINTLAGEERVIVSEIPGTTRDSVDVRFEMKGKTFLAIDTAGIRKRSKVRDSIEFYSLMRAERSIRRADVILLTIDATETVGTVVKKLSGYIIANFKPCVIVVNKWDLAVGKADIEDFADYLGKTLPGLRYAPICLTCAEDAVNVNETISMALKLFEQASTRVPTAQLNDAVETIRTTKPPSPSRSKGYPKFYYATQIGTCPPTIVIFVNDRAAFTGDYERFLVNRFRELLPFEEIPIRLLIRERAGGG